METLFGRGRWLYWTGMAVLVAGVFIVLKIRKSPEEIAQQRLVWGDEAMSAGYYEQAVAFYERAIKEDPTLLPAYFNLALALEQLDRGKAATAWDEYIARAKGVPDQADWLATAREHRARLAAEPYYLRAMELAAAGDREGARAAFAKALAIEPNSLETLRGAAANEAAAGDYRAGAAYYERALALAPYSMKIKYELARIYERYDKKRAAVLWAEVLEMSKTRTDLETEKLLEAQKRLAALRREGYHG